MISGVAVASRPEHVEEVGVAIEAHSWAQVHYSDPHGRMVVTLEASGVEESMRRLLLLQELPRVLSVTLVEYCMEDDEPHPIP